jgi:hypothetical protein
MQTVSLTTIKPGDCVGDSRIVINNNFASLTAAVYDVYQNPKLASSSEFGAVKIGSGLTLETSTSALQINHDNNSLKFGNNGLELNTVFTDLKYLKLSGGTITNLLVSPKLGLGISLETLSSSNFTFFVNGSSYFNNTLTLPGSSLVQTTNNYSTVLDVSNNFAIRKVDDTTAKIIFNANTGNISANNISVNSVSLTGGTDLTDDNINFKIIKANSNLQINNFGVGVNSLPTNSYSLTIGGDTLSNGLIKYTTTQNNALTSTPNPDSTTLVSVGYINKQFENFNVPPEGYLPKSGGVLSGGLSALSLSSTTITTPTLYVSSISANQQVLIKASNNFTPTFSILNSNDLSIFKIDSTGNTVLSGGLSAVNILCNNLKATTNIQCSTLQVSSDPSSNFDAINKSYFDEFKVPYGGIIMWSGSIDEVPTGWAICDGRTQNTRQTPNLTDKFILSYGTRTIGTTGGNDSYSTGPGGSHNHGGFTGEHSLLLTQIPPHTHQYDDMYGAYVSTDNPLTDYKDVSGVRPVVQQWSNGTSIDTNTQTGTTTWSEPLSGTQPVSIITSLRRTESTGGGAEDSAISHKHTISENTSHTHTISNAYPPYYVLAFIMNVGVK